MNDRFKGERAAPVSQTALREMWATVLMPDAAPDAIADTDNFFDLGGQSLSAVLILAQLAEQTGLQLLPAVLFEHPVFRDFCEAVAQAAVEAPNADDPASAAQAAEADLDPDDDEGDATAQAWPLSFQQAQLWSISRLAGSSTQYNIPLAYALDGELDEAALKLAFELTARRNEILRTTYGQGEGEPFQTVHPALPLPWRVEAVEDSAAVAARIEAFAGTEFDLGRDMPLAVLLLRIAPQRHVLAICVHHIAFDGFSMKPFFAELSAAYRLALGSGAHAIRDVDALAATDRRAPPVPYRRFAQRSQRRAAQGSHAAGVAYFADYLDGIEALNALPVDRPRRAVAGTAVAATLSRTVPPALLDTLKTLARGAETTLFCVFYAVLGIALARHTGRQDVVVGVPTANRTDSDCLDVVGFFANNVVLRTRVDFAQSFDTFVRAVAENVQRTFAHHQTPFAFVVDALSPSRSSAHNPIFQIAFAFQNSPEPGELLSGLHARPLPVANRRAKFDLTINVAFTGDGARIDWEYDSSLFLPATIEALAAHYLGLLRAATPDAPLHRLDPVDADSPEGALLARLAHAREVTGGASIVSRFDDVAGRRPAAAAIVHRDGVMTYSALARASEALAMRLLVARGVETLDGEPVAFFASRDPVTIIVELAILKAGGAYVPIDRSYPPQRVAFVLEDSGACLFVKTAGDACAAPPGNLPIVAYDWRAPSEAPAEPAQRLPRRQRGDAPAYLMYTSGSTGNPKGVRIPQRGVVRLACPDADSARFVPLSNETVMLHASSPGFDASTFEIWGALLNGGTLVCYASSVVDPRELVEVVAAQGVNTMWLTAGLLSEFAAIETRLPHLRWLLTGGDVVPPSAVARLQAREPQLTVINGYGPTENTTFTCCHTIERPVDAERALPIGTPIPGTSVKIVGTGGFRCGIGEPGELWTGGEGLADGYHRAPEATRARFVDDGGRWYRTGDIVRMRHDGVIDYLGRGDAQVKIRGYRIELEEIERSLHEHPAVSAAAVLVLGDDAQSKTLAAFVVAGGERDAAGLRAWLGTRLPAYAVPGRWCFVDALPANVSGKVDRRKLLALAEAQAPQPEAQTALSPDESRVAQVWTRVLGPQALRPDSDFFDVGGDSLRSIRVAAELGKAWGREVPVAALYDHPTLRALTAFLAARDAAPRDRARPAVFAIPGVGGLAAAFAPLGTELRRHGIELVAFDSPGWHADRTLPIDARLLAYVQHVVDAIRRRTPHGPYQLIGHSFGARVAFDVALALEEAGGTVALTMLDALPGNDLVDMSRWRVGQTPRELAGWLLGAMQNGDVPAEPGEDAVASLARLQIYGDLDVHDALALVDDQMLASRRYRPARRLRATRVQMVYAEHGLIGAHAHDAIVDSLRAWADTVAVARLDADHFSMLKAAPALAGHVMAHGRA
ncbi:amino acid adenylation domain-containing protein [Ralstonia sp. SM1864_UCD524_TZ4]|uniref:Macromolecule metabolism macromolecule synthesis, modification proteins and peptides-translation and modification n=1 Tax=Ralstonia solanacearum TaxID=305 RepID=A0A0S4UJL8_RALSL|nr:non-ribosomal peptide synthetase [Ralstonia pseudosolanacearum]CUV22427.1 Macromolecule metabolism macromolecule synthesis, modification proteins and peptides-translation and modification [Ralstonia solanacearum]